MGVVLVHYKEKGSLFGGVLHKVGDPFDHQVTVNPACFLPGIGRSLWANEVVCIPGEAVGVNDHWWDVLPQGIAAHHDSNVLPGGTLLPVKRF